MPPLAVVARPDIPGLVVRILKAAPLVTALVPATRIWAEEIPASETNIWPPNEARSSIVVQSSAGAFSAWGRTFTRVGSARVDIKCYGPTARACSDEWNAVFPTLKHVRRSLMGSTLAYGVVPIMERTMLREPETGWWFALGAFETMAAEMPAPA